MRKFKWSPFPYPSKEYNYPGEALKKHWARLHQGDKEPYPSAELLSKWADGNGKLHETLTKTKLDFAQAAEHLQEAWRLYHRGEFQSATQLGLSVGTLGHVVANKACAIYANYLEENPTRKLTLFEEVAERAQQTIEALPVCANAHFWYAYTLGRYSQTISVLRALSQGLGGKVKAALDQTLLLEPHHAEAHIALGAYHAEIIDKVGALIGSLTYGASEPAAIEHYKKALQLAPQSAVAHIEYARGLRLLYGEQGLDEARGLDARAAKLQPRDAMERLDVEAAKAALKAT